MKQKPEAFRAFLRGFKNGSNLDDLIEADEQWAAHSRQLSDAERDRVENRGYAQGFREGQLFRSLYPIQETDEDDLNYRHTHQARRGY